MYSILATSMVANNTPSPNPVLGSIFLGIGFLGLFIGLFMLRRNRSVGDYRLHIIDLIGKRNKEDIDELFHCITNRKELPTYAGVTLEQVLEHGSSDIVDNWWMWRYDAYNSVSYTKMLFTFWKPIEKQFPEKLRKDLNI